MDYYPLEVLKRAGEIEKLSCKKILKKILEEIELIELALSENIHSQVDLFYLDTKECGLKFLKESLLSDSEKKEEFLFQIQTGNGGIDAEELSLMLLKVYLQYFEKNKIKFELVDVQYSSSGLKKCVAKVDYEVSKFLMEEGIHRFVRISPSNQKRQTSFVAFSIYQYISEKDKSVVIEDKDLRIDVFRASGAGGQHVNTTESAVRITHIPTGISVQCQNERSQYQNKAIAMNILKSLVSKKREETLKKETQKERQSISWSNHFRSYTFNPSKRIKDDRLDIQVNSVGQFNKFFEGDIEEFLEKGIWVLLDSKIKDAKS